jgi:DNA-binding CsgD family transcriptional regulator
MPANNEDVLGRIEFKLDQMLRLTALQMTQGMKQTQAILMLGAAGLDRRTIAELLNTTPNTVSVTLSTSKAKARISGRAVRLPESEASESQHEGATRTNS